MKQKMFHGEKTPNVFCMFCIYKFYFFDKEKIQGQTFPRRHSFGGHSPLNGEGEGTNPTNQSPSAIQLNPQKPREAGGIETHDHPTCQPCDLTTRPACPLRDEEDELWIMWLQQERASKQF